MKKTEQPDEERILRDMPLHVAGLLDARRRTEIDAAIEESALLREAYEKELKLAGAVKDHAEIDFDTERGWSDLAARIAADQESVEREQSAVRPRAGEGALAEAARGLAGRIADAASSFFLQPAPAFALGAAAMLAVTVGAPIVFGGAGVQEDDYLTLSTTPVEAEPTQSYLVIFKSNVTSQDILDFAATTELTLTGVEPSADAFIFTAPTSSGVAEAFPEREDLIEFYAEIR